MSNIILYSTLEWRINLRKIFGAFYFNLKIVSCTETASNITPEFQGLIILAYSNIFASTRNYNTVLLLVETNKTVDSTRLFFQ